MGWLSLCLSHSGCWAGHHPLFATKTLQELGCSGNLGRILPAAAPLRCFFFLLHPWPCANPRPRGPSAHAALGRRSAAKRPMSMPAVPQHPGRPVSPGRSSAWPPVDGLNLLSARWQAAFASRWNQAGEHLVSDEYVTHRDVARVRRHCSAFWRALGIFISLRRKACFMQEGHRTFPTWGVMEGPERFFGGFLACATMRRCDAARAPTPTRVKEKVRKI